MRQTRDSIIHAFLALLEEKPFQQITVRDIVERCGINRNTFYYHFQDIPSLLEQILVERIDRLIAEHCHLGSLDDCISVTVQYFIENRTAVLHVYRSLPRDVFLTHLDRLLLYLVTEYIENIAKTMPIAPDDRTLIIRYFKCTLVGIFLDWLDQGMEYDLQADSLRICQLWDDSGLQMLWNACAPEQ